MKNPHRRAAWCAIVFLSVLHSSAAGMPRAGSWRAWLDSPGEVLPFGLVLTIGSNGWQATLVNGLEHISVPRTTWTGNRLVIDIDYYDSKITAETSDNGSRLDGEWVKRAADGGWTRMPFHATLGSGPRFPRRFGPSTDATRAALSGRWLVRFSKSKEPAIGLIQVHGDDTATATFLTTTGDYRFLAGDLHKDQLRLSCFDGAHAFLFKARLAADGTLSGDFWSRDKWHETWTATKDTEASLPDAFGLSAWTGSVELGALNFPDVDGVRWSLDDPKFAGRARIIEIFGTWCPNCKDATNYLSELLVKYGRRGLSVLGLAFELTGDFERDADMVRTYVRRQHVRYPVLIAGVSDKAKASKAFPALDRIRAYPTTIFLDRTGEVVAVYTGFSGPASGPEYLALRARFEAIIEGLLADSEDEP